MLKTLLLKLGTWIISLTYEAVTLDDINKKMIRPVEELVIDGVQYYEFVNAADMPEARFVHYQHLRAELTMSMGTDLINQYLDEMEIANNDKNSSRSGSLIYMMRDTVNNCTPLEVLYNMAALVYFDKKEDLSCFDGDYNQRKIALFKKYPNQGFFFDRLLRKGLKTVGVESDEDIKDYLMKSAVKLKTYERILSARSATKHSEILSAP
jgi:hypothetical protein